MAITFTRTTVNPLRGTGSFLLSKDATDNQGRGFSYDFTIDPADKTKLLKISFDYETSTNYVDGDMRIYIYDITNSRLIELVNRDLMANTNGTYSGFFQASPDSVNYRLIGHVSSTSALAYEVKVDNVVVEPQGVKVTGAVVTDWKDFTASSTWSTYGTNSGRYRRIGDSIEVEQKITLTATPSGTLHFNIPDGLVINTSKVIASVDTNFTLGISSIHDNGANYYSGFVRYSSTTSVQPVSQVVSSTYSNPNGITATAPVTFVSGDSVTATYKVPISGWSSNLILSEDAGNREIVFKVAETINQTLNDATNTKVAFSSPTISWDTASGWDATNSRWIVPETGYYDIDATLRYSANATARNLGSFVYANGVSIGTEILGSTSSANTMSVKNNIIAAKLNKGDYVEVYGYQNDISGSTTANLTVAVLSIAKRSSPQTIAASETVAARYTSNSGQAVTDATTIVFEDKVYDTHNAYNTTTGAYVIPQTGKYRFETTIEAAVVAAGAVNNYLAINVRNNTTATDNLGTVSFASTTSSRGHSAGVSITLDCTKGDSMIIRFVETLPVVNLTADSTTNWLSITKVGN